MLPETAMEGDTRETAEQEIIVASETFEFLHQNGMTSMKWPGSTKNIWWGGHKHLANIVWTWPLLFLYSSQQPSESIPSPGYNSTSLLRLLFWNKRRRVQSNRWGDRRHWGDRDRRRSRCLRCLHLMCWPENVSISKAVSIESIKVPWSRSFSIAVIQQGRSARRVLKAGIWGNPRINMLMQIFMLKTKCTDCSFEILTCYLEMNSGTWPDVQVEL